MGYEMDTIARSQTLIDKAAKVCGSRYALAKRMHVSDSMLGQMARGTRPIGPRIAARVAAIAGADPRLCALVALVEAARDDEERVELATLFGLPLDLADLDSPTSSKVFFTRTLLRLALLSERLDRQSNRSVMDTIALRQLERLRATRH